MTTRTQRLEHVRAKMDNAQLKAYIGPQILPRISMIDDAIRLFNKGIAMKNLVAREHMAAYKIQQWWLFITSSPEYAVGRRRIEAGYVKEFGGEKN